MLGYNRNQFLIKEGGLGVGSVSSPSTITTATDPMLSFTLEYVGYFQQGTVDPQINREYAEFLAGTPAVLARKDLIRKSYFINAQLAQYNADLMALVQGLEVETGNFDIAWIGYDELPQADYAYAIQTELVDGSGFDITMFSGKQTGEAVGPKLPGTAHSTFDFKAEAFPHPDFDEIEGGGARAYGMIVFDQAS